MLYINTADCKHLGIYIITFFFFSFSGVDKFQHTCAVSEYTDDLSVGAIISNVKFAL